MGLLALSCACGTWCTQAAVRYPRSDGFSAVAAATWAVLLAIQVPEQKQGSETAQPSCPHHPAAEFTCGISGGAAKSGAATAKTAQPRASSLLQRLLSFRFQGVCARGSCLLRVPVRIGGR